MGEKMIFFGWTIHQSLCVAQFSGQYERLCKVWGVDLLPVAGAAAAPHSGWVGGTGSGPVACWRAQTEPLGQPGLSEFLISTRALDVCESTVTDITKFLAWLPRSLIQTRIWGPAAARWGSWRGFCRWSRRKRRRRRRRAAAPARGCSYLAPGAQYTLPVV